MSVAPDLYMCEVTQNLALHTSADSRLRAKDPDLSKEVRFDVKLKTNISNWFSISSNSFLSFVHQISQVTAFLQTSKDLTFKNRRLVFVHWKMWMFLVLSSVKKKYINNIKKKILLKVLRFLFCKDFVWALHQFRFRKVLDQ